MATSYENGELLCLRVMRGSARAGPIIPPRQLYSDPWPWPFPPALQYFFRSSFLRVKETKHQ